MTLKHSIEVRSVKSEKFTVRAPSAGTVKTADFVSEPPLILEVIDGAIRAVTVGSWNVDIREINKSRRGKKQPLAEVTSDEVATSTR